MACPIPTGDRGLGTQRLEAFSDGVFAIVITLLVLDLKVPELAPQLVHQELPRQLLALWPKLLSYVVSFVVVGVYWVGHHNMFHDIRRADRTLLWLNNLFLLCVACMPFPAALLGRYPQSRLSVFLYGATLIIIGLVFCAVWRYAASGDHLMDHVSDRRVAQVTRRILMGPAISAAAVGASFAWPTVSYILYALTAAVYVLPGPVDQQWSGSARPGK